MKHITLLGVFAGVCLAGCATKRIVLEPNQPIVYRLTDYKMDEAIPGMEVFTDEDSQVMTNYTTFYKGTMDRWIVNVSTQDLVIDDPRHGGGSYHWVYEYASTNGFASGGGMGGWGSIMCGGCTPTQVLKAGESYFLGKDPFDFELPIAVTAAVYHAEIGLTVREESCGKITWQGMVAAEPLRIPLASYRGNNQHGDPSTAGSGSSVQGNQAPAGPVDWTQSELLSMVSKLKVDMPREDVEKIVGPPVVVFIDQYGCKGIYYIRNPDTFIGRKRMRMRNGPYSFTGLTARFVDEKLYMVDYNPSWIDQDRLASYIQANPLQDVDIRDNRQYLKWEAILNQRQKQSQSQEQQDQPVNQPSISPADSSSTIPSMPPF
jgi:hypothetical protein